MSGLGSNRGMWLLRITSKHHSPERLAWAVALGLLAGMLPKLNLLAVGAYAVLLLLPIHTLLAFSVSVIVSFASPLLDPVTDRLGEMLLGQAVLSWLWTTLDNAPLVPWMALHNTVVLGSLVIATATTAPTYMLCLRLFEHWEYDAPRSAEHNYAAIPTEQKPLVAPPSVDRTRLPSERWQFPPLPTPPGESPRESATDGQPAIETGRMLVPPPKFVEHRRDRSSLELPAGPESTTGPEPQIHFEPIRFEPVAGDPPPVNQWHMSTNSGDRAMQMAGVDPEDQVARVDRHQTMNSMEHDIYPESTWRGEAVDSLQIAQSANDVLAWVDEMLDECLAEPRVAIVAPDLQPPALSIVEIPDDTSVERNAVVQGEPELRAEPRWLVETTIEIVRWADESIHQLNQIAPHQRHSVTNDKPTLKSDSSATAAAPTSPPANNQNMISEGLVRNSVLLTAGRTHQATAAEELTILPITGALKRPTTSAARNTSTLGSMVNQPTLPANGSQIMERSQPIDDANKSECLGYLLGHLRQAREGKST